METIILTSYASNGNFLGYDRHLDENDEELQYPEGTFNSLRSMEHPELDGLDKMPNAARWEFYCFETAEILLCNADGIIPINR